MPKVLFTGHERGKVRLQQFLRSRAQSIIMLFFTGVLQLLKKRSVLFMRSLFSIIFIYGNKGFEFPYFRAASLFRAMIVKHTDSSIMHELWCMADGGQINHNSICCFPQCFQPNQWIVPKPFLHILCTKNWYSNCMLHNLHIIKQQ